MEALIEEHTQYIREGLEFIGITDIDSLEVTMQTGPTEEIKIIQWKLVSKQMVVPVAGSYGVKDAGDARLNVIMSIGLMRHRYGAYIYQAILAADTWMIPSEDYREHNTLLQILVREALADAIHKMPRSVVKEHVKKAINLDVNFVFIDEQHKAFKAKEAAQKLLDNKFKGNGKGK